MFVPCCFLGGITGQFFRQFAVTIAVSTIISAVNALTMTPSRAVLIFQTSHTQAGHEPRREALPWWIFAVIGGALSVWLAETFLAGPLQALTGANAAPAGENAHELSWTATAIAFLPGAIVGGCVGWLVIRPVNAVLGVAFRAFQRLFDRLTAAYGWAVGHVLRHSLIVLLVYAGLLALTYWQLVSAPTGFIPQQDKGYLILNVQLPDSASVERTERMMARIESLARETAGVNHTLGVSGTSLILQANAPNLGSMYVLLKPFAERHSRSLSADAIAKELQERCQHEVRGAMVTTFGGPPVEGLGTTGGFKLLVEDRGNLGPAELQRVSDRIVARAAQTAGLRGLFNSSRASTPWLHLEIDRTKCLALGVSLADVFTTLQVYFGSYYVNNYNEFGRTWQVNVQADPRFRTNIDDIQRLQVRSSQGQMIRLGTLLAARDTSGPVMVLRYNLYSAAAITGDAAVGGSSGQALAQMQQIADEELPASMATDWTELAHLQSQTGNVALFGFALSVMFVFLVLAAQYESWSLPLAVILVVPMCLLCSVSGIALAGMEVNIFTQIGFVVLVGLACKNAILIVEFAKRKQD
ncbi:MAG TPA: efflux RND transporter permease subunit, partial [Pirellulales bacterium]